MGAFGAILLSLMYRKFTFSGFFDNLVKSLEITVSDHVLSGCLKLFWRRVFIAWHSKNDDRDVAWVRHVTLFDLDPGDVANFPFGMAIGMGADRIDRRSGFAANRGEA